MSSYFFSEFVPNIQTHNRTSYAQWKAANPNEAAKWEAFRDALATYEAGDALTPPKMATKYGRALVAAGKEHMSVTDIGADYNPPVTPPPTDPDLLSWQPPGYPTYTGYERYTITNASTVPTAAFNSNRDVVFTIGEPLTRSVNIQGWRNVVMIGGAWNNAQNTLINRAIAILYCTGTVHLEGLDLGKSNTYYDATIGVATGPGASTTGARVQIQNCRLYSGYQTDIGSGTHCDVVQNWPNSGLPAGTGGGARGYRFDRCTFIAGYQGTFFGNHSGGGSDTQSIGDEDSYIRNSNYRNATNIRLATPIYYWKTWRVDPWGHSSTFYFSNVYTEGWSNGQSIIPNQSGGGTTIPAADSSTRGYTVGTDANGTYITWLSTSDQQGTIRVGSNPPGGDFCPAGTPGMAYTSPGYV